MACACACDIIYAEEKVKYAVNKPHKMICYAKLDLSVIDAFIPIICLCLYSMHHMHIRTLAEWVVVAKSVGVGCSRWFHNGAFVWMMNAMPKMFRNEFINILDLFAVLNFYWYHRTIILILPWHQHYQCRMNVSLIRKIIWIKY